MKKIIRISVLLAIFALFGFVSCSLDFDPAWKAKDGKTRLSFSIGTGASGARAVAPGGGYLYIRTVGGPTGDKGPAYGPYRVTPGSTFITTDIPPGSYDGMGILFAPEPLAGHSIYIEDVLVTFDDAMRFSDTDFINLMAPGLDNTSSYFEKLIDGDATGVYKKAVTIREGLTNTISATLVPIVGNSEALHIVNPAPLVLNSLIASGNAPVSPHRKFYRLENVVMPAGLVNNQLEFMLYSGNAPDGVTVSALSLYDSAGKLIHAFGSLGNIGTLKTVSTTYASGSTCYLYIASGDFVPEVKVQIIEGTLPAGTVSLVTDNVSLADKRVFYGVYPANSTMIPGMMPAMTAAGMFILDSNGNGSSKPVSMSTGNTVTLSAGSYYISMFVDVAGNYSDVNTLTDLQGSFGGLVPHNGDLVTESQQGFLVESTSGVYAITASDLQTCNDNVYFVSDSGIAGNSGATRASPMDFYTAWNQPGTKAIYVDGSVIIDDPYTQGAESYVRIQGVENSNATLALTVAGSFTIPGTGSMDISNLVVDGGNTDRGSSSPFLINMGGHLSFNGGNIVRNFNVSSGQGGAVHVQEGGDLQIFGTAFSNCKALSGGAIYLASGASNSATANMMSGSITGCSATGTAAEGKGGAVFVGTNAMFSFKLMTGLNPSITNNTAASGGGGGVYIFTGGKMMSPAMVSISSNTGGDVVSDVGGTWDNTFTGMVFADSSGNGDGTSSMSPMSFVKAINQTNASMIILTEAINIGSLTSSLVIDRPVTIAPEMAGSISLNAAIPSVSLFKVVANGKLNLHGITIFPSSGIYYAKTLVEVASGGVLYLGEGSVLSGNTATQNGGAVLVSGGTFYMTGGQIYGCSAQNGGGVAVESGTFIMNGGEIGTMMAGNNATGTGGGGVYVAPVSNANFTLDGGSISYNQANGGSGAGGGVWYNQSTSTGVFINSTVSGNTATQSAYNEIFTGS